MSVRPYAPRRAMLSIKMSACSSAMSKGCCAAVRFTAFVVEHLHEAPVGLGCLAYGVAQPRPMVAPFFSPAISLRAMSRLPHRREASSRGSACGAVSSAQGDGGKPPDRARRPSCGEPPRRIMYSGRGVWEPNDLT